MRKALWLLTAAFLLPLLAVVSCKSNNNDPNIGKWTAVSISALGLTIEVEAAFEYGASLELKSDGKCTLTIDGGSTSGEWSVADGILTITAGGESYTASVEENVLTMPMPLLALDVNFVRQDKKTPPSQQPSSSTSP